MERFLFSKIETWVVLLLAIVGLVAMVVSTLLINAPINDAVDTWNAAAPPADWQSLRDRWELGHAIRSYIGLIALVVAQAAVIWETK